MDRGPFADRRHVSSAHGVETERSASQVIYFTFNNHPLLDWNREFVCALLLYLHIGLFANLPTNLQSNLINNLISTVFALQLSLACLTRAAPTGQMSELTRVVEGAQSLVKKVLGDIPAVHGSSVVSPGMTLDPAEGSVNLEYMEALLEIPSAPKLQPLAPDFTLETCLNHMSAGLRLYSGLLQVVGARLSSPLPLSQLHADIKDLKTQVHKIQELSRVSSVEAQMDVSGVSSHLTGDYEVQLATHVVLSHLRSFTQDTYRSLRNIAQTTVA